MADYIKHHISHPHPHKPAADLSHFYVVTVISNPVRYKRRYELYWQFAEMIKDAGVNLITVEQAFGNRPFMVTESGNPNHVQVRSFEELWHKENMINLGIQRAKQVDPLVREIAWIDADVMPMRPAIHWIEETWHLLQHYEFVQMFSHVINFGPSNEPISGAQNSFVYNYIQNGFKVVKSKQVVHHTLGGHSGRITEGRTGFAWAANISALDQVGGLIDFCILGSGDWHMAHGLVGAMEKWNDEYKNLSSYARKLLHWQSRCETWIKRDVGCVQDTIGHWFHGKLVNRQYATRGQILIGNHYNPDTDIKYDSQGLLQLETHSPRQIKLRDQIRGYFKARNEDSIDL